MEEQRAHRRYVVRASSQFPGMWAVEDVFLGRPVVQEGLVLDGMTLDDAAEMAWLMHARDLLQRHKLDTFS